MSRIGRKPIPLPQGVSIDIDGTAVKVKGPKGEMKQVFSQDINIVLEDGQILVQRNSDHPSQRSLHGLTRSLLNSMVIGVTTGFEKALELVGVGYRAQKQGNKLVLSVGYSHPVEIDPPAGIEIEVPLPTKVVVKGIDKQAVGAMAANIREVREPEPYKGKGIKYDGEIIRRKAGKSGAKGKK